MSPYRRTVVRAETVTYAVQTPISHQNFDRAYHTAYREWKDPHNQKRFTGGLTVDVNGEEITISFPVSYDQPEPDNSASPASLLRWAADEIDAQAATHNINEPQIIDLTDHIRCFADQPDRRSIIPWPPGVPRPEKEGA